MKKLLLPLASRLSPLAFLLACLLPLASSLMPSAYGQAVSGPSSATANAIPTYQDNKHILNNPGLTFTNTVGLTVSNNVYVATNLYVTNQLVPLQVGASKLAGTAANGAVTNIVVGTGLSLSAGTLSATGGSGSVTNAVITLTLGGTGGTNVSGGDWSLGSASGTTFKLVLTTNAFFGDGAFSNVPNTNGAQTVTLHIIEDSTGVHTVTFTNGGATPLGWVNGVQYQHTTNANSLDVLTLFNSVRSNGLIFALPANNLHL